MVLSPRLGPSATPSVSLDARQRTARDRVAEKIRTGVYRLESSPCPCGGGRDTVLALSDRYGLPVRTVLCRRCGLARTDPRMDAESNARFYREHYRQLYTRAADTERLFRAQQWGRDNGS